MKTVVLPGIDPESIATCAAALQAGQLVAFPTETVYGLGAIATDREAVAKIFEAKGRPATNPLISHVHSVEQAEAIAGAWSADARRLAETFWPGPLTLIVPRGSTIPEIVSAGLDSMGIRLPNHPVARALIRACDAPLAAPSANRYTEISPTTAQHVLRGLDGRLPYVLDGGPTQVGIESTVLSLTEEVPTILRPGMVTLAELVEVIGAVRVRGSAVGDDEARPSPGLSKRHYAPPVPVVVVDAIADAHPLSETDLVIASEPVTGAARCVALGSRPSDWARELYALFHRWSADELDRIVVVRPPQGDGWRAIHDRIDRAAAAR